MALINRATQKDIHQMKEAEYIEYTMELAGFDYEYECSECYALSISLPEENDENEIEFGVSELQPPLQLKYFDNHGQGIRPKKAHEIDAGYDLRYPGKDTLVLQSKSLTKINLKITLEIPPRAIVQIASKSSLASKKINVKEGVIYAGYTGDIIIIHTLLPNPNIIFTIENYHLLKEKLSRINMGSLKPQQQRQLKQLIAEFADIFAKDNNNLGKMNIV
ncbi:hypothetical protein G9A89_004781 [Geosiphon pyriformis]|nr:hypothetical protein G9A89_004781 [Geosiphon pyriformis]